MRSRELGITLFICIVIIFRLYFPCIAQAQEPNLIRLHVLANSDEAKDQELKLIIRDQVLSQLEALKNMPNTQEAINYIDKNLKRLQANLEDRIKKEGFNYALDIQLGKSDFPTRKYQNTVLPAGTYLALKVIIGEGKGANWWCVLFPPICHGDWVREPKRKMMDESKVLPVISDVQGELKTNNNFKKIWKEYTKLLIKVWSFSKSS